MKEDKGLTIKERCEVILKADFLIKRDGTKPTASEIYEYSPTGELGNIFLWYVAADAMLKEGAATKNAE